MTRLAILMPMRTAPTPETQYALDHNVCENFDFLKVVGKPVDVARNELARRVLEMSPRPEYCVMIDDDAFWLPGAIQKLVSLCNDDLTLVGVPCSPRSIGYAYEEFKTDWSRVAREDLGPDCPSIRMQRLGGHMLAFRTNILARIGPNPFAPVLEVSEDNAFGGRVLAAGGSLVLAAMLDVYHVDSGLLYAPYQNTAFRLLEDGLVPTAGGRTKAVLRSYGPDVDEQKSKYEARQRDRRGPVFSDTRSAPLCDDRAGYAAVVVG